MQKDVHANKALLHPQKSMIRQALVRMRGNPSQYDKFLSMLCAIKGLDQIVKAIEGGQYYLLRWLCVCEEIVHVIDLIAVIIR